MHEIVDLGGRQRDIVYKVQEKGTGVERLVAESQIKVMEGERESSFDASTILIRRAIENQRSVEPPFPRMHSELVARRMERRVALDQELRLRLQSERALRKAQRDQAKEEQEVKVHQQRDLSQRTKRVQRRYRDRGLPTGCKIEHDVAGKGFVVEWREDPLGADETLFEYLISFDALPSSHWIPEDQLVRGDDIALEIKVELRKRPGSTVRQLSEVLRYSKGAISRALMFESDRLRTDASSPPRWYLPRS